MNKQELINEISANAGPKITKSQIELVLSILADVVERDINYGHEVTLPRIGKIYVRQTAEREGRNPATGESITIPACKRVKFKAAKSLSDHVNGVQK